MNSIKQNFSIKDLENLCGIKAHTIRIWEKRYNLLNPERTNTNIRCYNLENLQKLLNVTYLVNSGYKISRISKLSQTEIDEYVRRIVSANSLKNQSINSFKIAMLNYDQELFLATYEELAQKSDFRQIFYTILMPFLNEVGLLWQSNTISAAHEHFVTGMIKQKILLNIENLQRSKPQRTDKRFILFLPENELNDLGLLFVNYEILLKGYRAISLGPNVPVGNLPNPDNFAEEIVYVSYFTIQPEEDTIHTYLSGLEQSMSGKKNWQFWMLGKQVKFLPDNLPGHYKRFDSIEELTYMI